MRLPSLSTRPSPSMAVSILALVVASTGTSYAAGLISSDDVKDNSIRSKDIRNSTIQGKDIKKGAVGSFRVKNGSLKKKDLAPGVLPVGDTRWLLVGANGAIVAQSGGFEVDFAYPVLPNSAVAPAPDNSLRANGNVYIETNEDLSDNGIVATIALQNTVDQDGGGMAGRTAPPNQNAEFSGEISVSQCGLPGTTCAPPGTNFPEYLVVSPRNSDGSVTTDGVRKRFYVILSGDSSDFVAP